MANIEDRSGDHHLCEDTVAGWNAAPTGFVWDGNRSERRIAQHNADSRLRRSPNHQLIAA